MSDQLQPARRNADRPILFLLIGLPGAGKTTCARELERDHAALRLSPDDWILDLYGHDLDRTRRDAVRDPVEALQWAVARRALALGCNVILDWGFWSRAERTAYRQQAAALGATVRLVYLDATRDELWARIAQRPESETGTRAITRAELDRWASWFEPPDADELALIEC